MDETSLIDAQKSLQAMLFDMGRLYKQLSSLPRAEWLAIKMSTPGSLDGLPKARATLDHLLRVVGVARHHLFMALYERRIHNEFATPQNPGFADWSAYAFVTSFALHAIAAMRHFTIALSFQFNIPNREGEVPNGDTKAVQRELQRQGHIEYTQLLREIRGDADWGWLIKYRDRWEHRDPIRVKELGIQDSNNRQYWEKTATGHELSIRGGDAPEITIDKMLERSIRCFNLLATQIDTYIEMFREEIRGDATE